MKNKLFEELKKLNLPAGKFAVFGSAPICVVGIRDCRDLDLIVSRDLFDEYKNKEGWKLKSFERGGRHIEMVEKDDVEIEFYKDWAPGEWNVEELIKTAEMIDGLPFVRLKDTLKWKKISGREKDLRDVELIEEYLKSE